MDQSRAPLLEALADYHRRHRHGFSPPGHRQGGGVDPRVVEVLGRGPFRADVLATAGLDPRRSSHGCLAAAEQLMAEAVGAEHAFFSAPIVDYLRSGVAAGMRVPDAADPSPHTIRVVALP